jgi:hypothetical protein
MAKKIYDILPPEIIKKAKDSLKSLDVAGKRKKVRTKNTHSTSNKKAKNPQIKPVADIIKKGFPAKEVLIGGLIAISLLGIYFYKKLPKADIEIWPKLNVLNIEVKVTADKTIDAIDLNKNAIPATYIEQTEEGSQEFQATGIAPNDSKATGFIKIYNKISPTTPLTLKKGTHFLSDSGKYFITLEKVTIPAAQKKVPGSIEAMVQAKESGKEYNIGPSKFSVPKLSGTEYYYSIFAESENDMTGGYSGSLKKVIKDDISQAKDDLTKKLLTRAEEKIISKFSKDDVILEGSVLREIISSSSDAKPELLAEKFNYSAKVRVSALMFKKQDLEKFAKDYVSAQLSYPESFLEKSMDVSYSPDLIDIKKGVETINLQSRVKTYRSLDINSLIDSLTEKSSEDIKEAINLNYGDNASDIKVKFWPFWVKESPINKNRINVNLNFGGDDGK